MKETTDSHPSYGVAELSRISGLATLVGSEIQHHHYFQLVIKEAERVNSFGEVRFFGRNRVCEVYLSANQLMDLITQTNTASATCCTISAINGVRRPAPPKEVSRIELASKYGKDSLSEDIERSKSAVEKIKEILERVKIPQNTKIEILNHVHSIRGNLESNADFYVERVTEAAEKSISIAKVEIEAHISSAIRSIGLKHIGDLQKILESGNTSD